MSHSKFDRNQIEKMSFDEETRSRRVYLAGGELSIELSAYSPERF